MLEFLGFDSLESFVCAVVPPEVRRSGWPAEALPEPMNEACMLRRLRALAAKNKLLKSYIGLGVYGTVTPSVIKRCILENPGWYTPYTPYQAEIAQGRLEALMNFQTMVADLTGMDVANASMLDGATAAAEAMLLCRRVLAGRNEFAAGTNADPHILAVLRTYADAAGIDLRVVDLVEFDPGESCCGVLVQYPDTFGVIRDLSGLVKRAHQAGALVVCVTDLLALVLVVPPGVYGVDVVVGSAQRFGVPPGFGGPHPGFFATRSNFLRQMPGRLVGLSRDRLGAPAYRLALQTREQHIRRHKATSNICTAQSLTAIVAGMYAVYHGPRGLRRIAERVHRMTLELAHGLTRLGFEITNDRAGDKVRSRSILPFFDTLTVDVSGVGADRCLAAARNAGFNLRRIDPATVGIALDETADEADVQELLEVFHQLTPREGWRSARVGAEFADLTVGGHPLARKGPYLTHPVFNRFNSEPEFTRYVQGLCRRDLALDSGMIPLGSCTMKLNPAAGLEPFTWPEFAELHPCVPTDQAEGFAEIFRDLEQWLCAVTGMDVVCFQPLSGAHGEFAGLLTIRAYHRARGQPERNVCLVPDSAHGTNPASAAMAGFELVPVRCDENGNLDLLDLEAKAAANAARLGAIMITYPSTHGVFEPGIVRACAIVHAYGGLVYFDGANLNALLGIARPGDLGADICHVNVHKTFGVPHGGGGPGAGPVCAKRFLAPYLPTSAIDGSAAGSVPNAGVGGGPISGMPYGNALVYVMVWAYFALFGRALGMIGPRAILNANYIACRLRNHFPVVFSGQNGFVAHECILDLRGFRSVTVEDVAKRLIDYGFHAPTMSWPVPGTLMVEPTESESKAELDRFCEALLRIHGEIHAVESGRWPAGDNPVRNAPHTAAELCGDAWSHVYSRAEAACLDFHNGRRKYWPPVSRIDNVSGDRNPVLVQPVA